MINCYNQKNILKHTRKSDTWFVGPLQIKAHLRAKRQHQIKIFILGLLENGSPLLVNSNDNKTHRLNHLAPICSRPKYVAFKSLSICSWTLVQVLKENSNLLHFSTQFPLVKQHISGDTVAGRQQQGEAIYRRRKLQKPPQDLEPPYVQNQSVLAF